MNVFFNFLKFKLTKKNFVDKKNFVVVKIVFSTKYLTTKFIDEYKKIKNDYRRKKNIFLNVLIFFVDRIRTINKRRQLSLLSSMTNELWIDFNERNVVDKSINNRVEIIANESFFLFSNMNENENSILKNVDDLKFENDLKFHFDDDVVSIIEKKIKYYKFRFSKHTKNSNFNFTTNHNRKKFLLFLFSIFKRERIRIYSIFKRSIKIVAKSIFFLMNMKMKYFQKKFYSFFDVKIK